MSDCRQINELMMDYLYHELAAPQAEAFEAHVHGCATCGAELASLERTRTAMRELPEAEPSPAVTARLMHEAAKRAPRAATAGGQGQGFFGWLAGLFQPVMAHPAWSAAAALVLVAGVAGLLAVRGKVSEKPALYSPGPASERAEAAGTATAAEPAPVTAVTPPAGAVPAGGAGWARDEGAALDSLKGGAKEDEGKARLAAPAEEAQLRGDVSIDGTTGADVPISNAGPALPGGLGNAPPPAPSAESRTSTGTTSVYQRANQNPSQAGESYWDKDGNYDEEADGETQAAKPPAKKAEKATAESATALHTKARTSARAGKCGDALAIRAKIQKVDADYYRRKVATDTAFASCDGAAIKTDPDRMKQKAPAPADDLEVSPADGINQSNGL